MRPMSHGAHRGGSGRGRRGLAAGSPDSVRGATVVEFALVAAIFIFLLLGITDFGRWFFAANAASEAARLGARLAAVCSPNSYASNLVPKIAGIYPGLTRGNVEFELNPPSCAEYGPDPDTVCQSISVRLKDLRIETVSPYIPGGLPLPGFRVTLPRESMEGAGNSVCS